MLFHSFLELLLLPFFRSIPIILYVEQFGILSSRNLWENMVILDFSLNLQPEYIFQGISGQIVFFFTFVRLRAVKTKRNEPARRQIRSGAGHDGILFILNSKNAMDVARTWVA
ncbi:hypothetical protein ABFS83_11G041600 [Erythranthe nasuta]